MSLPAFANNCHDAFDPETEKEAEWNEKEFKRGYLSGVKKTKKTLLRDFLIFGAIGSIGAIGMGAGYLVGQEMIDVLDKKTELMILESQQKN